MGIRQPRRDGMMGQIDLLEGASAFTSGDYERFHEHDAIRRHHTIDSRTGYPAKGTSSVTVPQQEAAMADAAATALFASCLVPRFCSQQPPCLDLWPCRMCVTHYWLEAIGAVYLSTAMAKRIRRLDPKPGNSVINRSSHSQ
ncbi:MAG: hypothetical protein BMS9Abin15_0273 [Gammaproteobacteria bacterium]|nr:MAG: hypothetical protein BMS9Abin15_0273 [Gammaproteobacteria bacterium]